MFSLLHPLSDRPRNRRTGLARILVTGAAGFIGRALCGALARRGHLVQGATRRPTAIDGAAPLPIGDIDPQTDWSRYLDGIDIVVHLANRAHRRVGHDDPEGEADTAAALARAAAASGVRRLLHMSSIRAMGEETPPGMPFRAAGSPRPRDSYGRSKLTTERALAAAARESGLDLVILRPPLVYGPAVKGNLAALIRLVATGLPLPFGGIDNRRSLIAIDNLLDLTALACVHPAAARRVLLARDATDLSTPQLLEALAAGVDRRLRLYPVPGAVFGAMRRVPRLGPLVARLTLSLQVDDSDTRALLGWAPKIAAEPGLAATARSLRRWR